MWLTIVGGIFPPPPPPHTHPHHPHPLCTCAHDVAAVGGGVWLGPSLQRLCERINTTQHRDPPDVTACTTAVQTLQAAHSAQQTNCTACKPHRLTSQPAPQLSKLYKQYTQCNGQTAPPDVTACTTAVQTLQAAHSVQRTNCTACTTVVQTLQAALSVQRTNRTA